MRRITMASAAAGLASIACALLATTSAALATVTPPATVPPPAATPPAPATGAPGSAVLALEHVGGSPPFALLGERITVQGTVIPYVGGQTVTVTFYREGKKVELQSVAVVALGTGAGRFQASYRSAGPGLVEARAEHLASAQQIAFAAHSPGVRFVNANVGPGASGQSVRLLQSELDVLHFAVPLSGVFEEGTERALIAYRKLTGIERVGLAGRGVWKRLLEHAGTFHVRFPRDGRHVEANLTSQVLAEIEPGGRVRTIYTVSSGKPSTPTVLGHFNVYSKTPGVNTEGMVDSNYFIRGYAIHGYPEVPVYAASHGCLRIPIPDAPAVFGWVQLGTPVDVYR
jgi:hypothetical protein